MSASSDLQSAICDLLRAPNALRVNVPVLDRFPGNQENDVLAATDKQTGLCIYVMPLVEQQASSMQGGDVIFFDAAELRVRILEQPRVNPSGVTAFDLKDDIIAALHWQPKAPGTALGAILAHPLQLARKPVELIEGILEESKQTLRILDVLFTATYGFQASP